MKSMSTESLQALILIIFDYLGDGEGVRAWPLVGSLTRTVDYLQLTTELISCPGGALMTSLQIVPPLKDWTAQEERRRLFWVIFLLDRFCSVSTGWNTSLTSEDVHRRLPADGGYFTREELVSTPFFGIWSKAVCRIGRSLANVPAQYNEEDPVTEPAQGPTPGSAAGLIDSSKLGAFAYCAEATESLSQVTTFFLQQKINWQDKEHAIGWLTRFKELDLRLNREVVNMDPNLTLAHITHNTSMILLHHSIAYPEKDWSDYVALPKDCSAQTCQHAAVETANIVNKFLTHTMVPFVNAQFAFCTFIAAKVLLYEHQATRRPLRSEFDRMKRNLEEMSSRWASGKPQLDSERGLHGTSELDQAARYANHLDYLYDASGQHPGQQPEQGYPQQSAAIPSPYPAAVSEGVLPNAQALNSVFLTGHSLQDQCLLSLSDALMDSQFLDMDRVITFEDTNFYLPDDACQWQKFS
ncbi:fungal specific transcription factor [Paraphaeosphaeria minitans]|uniref:Fungal specific transcription factor n=1 Tax=Paraphaeosphaeria minitans TaxID=565426 RepID=A0A9P6KWG5_9PLEO|nr:fungal specific transcription factor [Paraphaeosphaeria minitans]